MAEGTESLEAGLARLREASRERIPLEIAAAMAEARARFASSGIAGRVLAVGEQAPDFALRNVRGEEIRLGDLVGRSAVVLSFYRGGW